MSERAETRLSQGQARQQAAQRGQWQRLPLIESPRLRWGLAVGAVIYVVLALASVEVNWARVAEGAGRAVNFLGAFMQPDFVSRYDDIVAGLLESLTMTLTSTVVGVLLAIPVGLGAARNISPLPIYFICRAIIAVSRTFQEIIIAILFVVMFGFGPLAGMITLAFATIGFMAKLLAEDIEDLDRRQVEAVRATGASWWQTMNHAVQPQVMPRLIGLSVYRLDINFRESSVIGIVGAGGIGATLNTSLSRYEYDTSAAILLIIIAIVLLCEYSSSHVRRWTQ
jgi:phosphonate transport system permease protein